MKTIVFSALWHQVKLWSQRVFGGRKPQNLSATSWTESVAEAPASAALSDVPKPSAKGAARGSVDSTEMHDALQHFLFSGYAFRYNVLTDQVEYRAADVPDGKYALLSRRILNTMVIEARLHGVNCWDKDVERLLKSTFIPSYHPFFDYMEQLPAWDGKDRIVALAERVDSDPIWVNGFRRWLLGLASQWMGMKNRCANTLTPILISRKQGYAKSTFCRLLMPPVLALYYLDKFDLNARSNMELRLGQFGLINLDEFDRYSSTAMATLKNLVQLKRLSVKKAYASYYVNLERIASFIGTSNEMELLSDPTGSRRFLCVEVKEKIDCSPIDHEQLFAQLKELVQEGERVWMTSAEEQALQEHNLLFSRLRPEQEVFLRLYHAPEEGEKYSMLTTTEIHRSLCLRNPSAMRGISVYQLGRTLSAMGLKRVHTEYGNKYAVAKCA